MSKLLPSSEMQPPKATHRKRHQVKIAVRFSMTISNSCSRSLDDFLSARIVQQLARSVMMHARVSDVSHTNSQARV